MKSVSYFGFSMCKLGITVLIIISSLSNVKSQVINADSLKSSLETANKLDKANIYYQLSLYYSRNRLDSALYFGKKNLAFLNKNNFSYIDIVSQQQLVALVSLTIGDKDSTLYYFNKAKSLAVLYNDNELLVKVLLSYARYYGSVSNYVEKLKSLNEALTITKKYNIEKLYSRVYISFSFLYLSLNDIGFAVVFNDLAYKSLEPNVIDKDFITVLLSKGEIYYKQRRLDSSYYYFDKALRLSKEISDFGLIRGCYRKMAKIFILEKKFNYAINYADSSIAFDKRENNISELSTLVTYKAHIYTLKGEIDSALICNLLALKLRSGVEHKRMICSSIINIGGNYVLLKDYEKAQIYLDKGLVMAQSLHDMYILRYVYSKLILLYRAKNDYKNVLEATKLQVAYNDSIMSDKSKNELLFFKNNFELQRKEATSGSLKLKERTSLLVLAVAIILLMLVVIITIIIFLKKKKTAISEISKLSRVVESINQAIVISSIGGEIHYVNDGFLSLTGYLSKADIIGKPVNDFTNEECAKKLDGEIKEVLLTTGHWEGDFYNKHVNGTYIICDEVISTVFDSDNKPLYFVAIFHDISAMKAAEYKLELKQEELKKAVKTRDKLFSIIAHDLTGPFSSILGFSKLLVNDFEDYSYAEHRKFTTLIYESSKRTYDLLTNLLHWSRSHMGNIYLSKENINIRAVVTEVYGTLTFMLKNKQIDFVNNVDVNLMAFADRETVSVVIRNLISNAIKFTEKGGQIIVDAIKDNKKISISVEDNGVGISENTLVLLFDDNSSISEKGTSDEKGTGLGLSLCKEFVELNGGEIFVKSKLKKGSKFTFTLPINN